MCITHTHYLTLHTSLHIIYLDQQQMYAMRCTAVAPVEAGSHVGYRRQFPGTVAAADGELCGRW